MENLQFKVSINAPREKVWKALWEDQNYRNWTSAFSAGSYAESDWQEGSKILFLTPTGDGMYSLIDRVVPNEFMSFKHIGEVKGGNEQPLNDESRKWSGSFENYSLKQSDGKTELTVEVQSMPGFTEYLTNAFPKALQKVKEIAES